MSARVTPFAVPLRQPLRIGGVTVAARFGALIEIAAAATHGIAELAWRPQAGVVDFRDATALRVGLASAALDGAAQHSGRPLAALLGGVRRQRIPLNALLDARAPQECATQAAALVAAGFRCLKLKLDPTDGDGDWRRLTAIREAVGPHVALRADANAAWETDEAIAALRALAGFDLEYVEQPVAQIAALAVVRRAVPMRIAADESVSSAAALDAILAAGAADVIVLKPSLLGLRESVALAQRAADAGLAVVVTSALDTSLGIAAAAHVAAAIRGPLLPCGLATAGLLNDLARTPLRIERGELLLPSGAGLGLVLDRAALARCQVATAFTIPPPVPRASPRAQASSDASAGVTTRRDPGAPTASPGDGWAVRSAAGALSFAQLAVCAAAASARLRAAGIGRGDRVALLLADRLRFAVWLHGVTRLGAVAVPLGERSPAAEIERLLATCSGAALVSDTGTAGLAASLPDHLAGARIDATALPLQGAEVVASHADMHAALWPFGAVLDAPHSIVFTSGSTGVPKAVLLTHGNHLASAVGSALALGVRDDDRWLACLPLHHVGGLAILLRSAFSRVPVLLHERFDAAAVNRAIDEDGITLVSLVANMLQRVLDARGARALPPSLRCVLLGGGPAPQALLDNCARRGVPVRLTYGMTETASQLVTDGRPLLGAALRIVCDGVEVGPDTVGAIEVRGPMVSRGRLAPHGGLVACDTWLHTNDLGWRDGSGRLRVVGRADDVLISGGENVHPREVEEALESHPAVAEACVFGVPDATWGERVAACVRPQPGVAVDAAAVMAHARRRLAGFKVPRQLDIVEDFPRTAAGKIQRRAVRDALLAGS